METTTSLASAALPQRRLSYYIELTKPRILVMILITVVIAMIAVGSSVSLISVLHACVGTTLVAASASVLNQWLERERDGIMIRTCKRPLPSGRVASSQAAWMGWLMVVVGSVYLAVFVNLPTMWCGLATWGLYVWLYTPLKTISWTNTLVGTIPGALPVWMGWTAAGGSLLDAEAWILLGILVAWQLPHFMAIAFMYREQYESAGYKMITVTDKSGRGAKWHAIVGALALVILAPFALPPSSVIGCILMLCGIGVAAWQAIIVWRFVVDSNSKSARKMLHASLFHLPLTMLLVLLSSWST